MPVLLGQGVLARTRYVELPEPPGARKGVAGHGPALRLLIIGDSSAAGVGVRTQDEALLGQLIDRLADQFTVEYDLVAETGARTGDVLRWLDDLPETHYDVAVTALGVNDVTKGVSLRKWLGQQRELFDCLMTKFGARRVVISGLPPVGQFPLLPQPLRWVLGRQASRFDRYLRQMAEAMPGCVAVQFSLDLDQSNMSEDGFHPGPTVYAVWADEVAQIILNDPDLLDAAPTTP